VFADHRQPQAVLVALEIGFHAGPSILVLNNASHRKIRPTSKDHRMIVATFVFLGRRADRILPPWAHK
jgi:hypothetical protein